MVRVRVPKSAETMLTLRLKNPAGTASKTSMDSFFPTNAHMVMFAAAVGFDAKRFNKKPEVFKCNPDPIEMGVFHSQGLFQMVQCLGIFKEKTHAVAIDEERLAEIIEGYASEGFEVMNKWYEATGQHTLLFTLQLASEAIQRTALRHEV